MENHQKYGDLYLVGSGSFYYVNSCDFLKQLSVSQMIAKMTSFMAHSQGLPCCVAPPRFNLMARGTIVFLIFAIVWQIGVGALYSFFFNYNDSAFVQMDAVTSVFTYNYTVDAKTVFRTNTSQYPYPQAVVAIAMILIVVGLALIAGYIERSSVTGVAFTLLIFAMTIQNFFIFRGLLNRVGLNGNSGTSFFPFSYPQINYINFGNDLQSQKDTYALPSASFLDAVGASLAIYAGYTAVIGRIGLGEVFFLSWFGTFFYEINSQLLWKMFIPDNGYPSRAFAYGGTLGMISSLLIGKRDLTKRHVAFKSSSRTMAVAFLGTVLVWCSYPILVLSGVYTSATGKVVSMAGQVNIWLALAAGVVGCYAASSLSYRRFCLHDLIFTSLTGGIAFSSSTDINYNPGAATAIGFSVGLLMSLLHTNIKRKMNNEGVIDSNSAVFHFLIPSLLASLSSAILQGVGQSASSYNVVSISSANITTNSTVLYRELVGQGRTVTLQGGLQIIGWVISVAFGAASGGIIGLIYRSANDNFKEIDRFFNDATIYDFTVINLKDSANLGLSIIEPPANPDPQANEQVEERVQALPEPIPKGDQPANLQHNPNNQEIENGEEIEDAQREPAVDPQQIIEPQIIPIGPIKP